jgi:cytochrome c2
LVEPNLSGTAAALWQYPGAMSAQHLESRSYVAMSLFAAWALPARHLAAILGVTLAVSIVTARPSYAQALAAVDIIRQHGCPGCHVIPGIPEAVGTIGPTLEGLGSRARIVGGNLRNSPENLRRWLRNPKAVRMTMMPNLGLTEKEIDVLIKFLQTL